MRELLVAELLVSHIDNKAIRLLNISEPLQIYPSDGFKYNPLGLNRV